MLNYTLNFTEFTRIRALKIYNTFSPIFVIISIVVRNYFIISVEHYKYFNKENVHLTIKFIAYELVLIY